MSKRNKDEISAVCWKMFEKTGNPAYYSLYKKLNDDGDNKSVD